MVILEKRRKIIQIAIIICVVLFLGYQYYVAVYASISTESAAAFEYTDGIDAVGTFVRNEVAVTSELDGTVHFLVGNGEKVAKNGTIANVYSSAAASAAASRVSEIDKQLALISEIEGYNDTTAVDINTINNRIYGYLNDVIYTTQNGRYLDVGDNVTSLITMMTRKQIATGEQSDFGTLKAELSNERTSLVAQMGTPKGSILSDNAGYFVSTTDGFESVLTVEALDKYTPEYLSSVKEEAVSDKAIGKIVYDYEWYMLIPVSLSDSMHYKQGDVISVKTDATSCPRVTAKVERINVSEKGEDAVIVFSCSEMNSELASMRTSNVKLIKNEVSGIKVSSKAIRVKDGVTGVYVVSGLEAKFVTVDILYSEEEYKICELNTSTASKLRLYDKIIVKGKNLYDGKIIY